MVLGALDQICCDMRNARHAALSALVFRLTVKRFCPVLNSQGTNVIHRNLLELFFVYLSGYSLFICVLWLTFSNSQASMCKILWCQRSGSTVCETKYMPAAEGTPCGHDKVTAILVGICVLIESAAATVRWRAQHSTIESPCLCLPAV